MSGFDPGAIAPDRPVLIAGPTAGGKSALAQAIVRAGGGVIVNADALQVFDGWRILTARPSAADEAALPHALYGHVPFDGSYSAGAWLRDVAGVIARGLRPVIVGGTGLNFLALTRGLADIPPVPPEVRAQAEALTLDDLVAGLDARTRGRIDLRNRARVQRAWEVLTATGRPLADWQDDTPPPLLPRAATRALLVMPGVEEGDRRIARRLDRMLDEGLLAEVRALLPRWNPALGAAQAIGARELVAHLHGRVTLEEARAAVILQTRRYAKRQRTWARAHMQDWERVSP
ncbi:MAG: tRNA (adenosine(37)-N6)-dimethylallyltransferase MiaA [Rubellimicrobium sp.]|nr:tRNA (adenosine(37)-N6)-dimethylallyltransferase MiaA [Rubellimicrobium sp.]